MLNKFHSGRQKACLPAFFPISLIPTDMHKTPVFVWVSILLTIGIICPARTQPQSFSFTPNNQSGTLIGKAQINGFTASAADWIAAFDSLGNCAGASQLLTFGADTYISLTIYGDDPNTLSADEGVSPGERFFLFLWDASANQTYAYTASCDTVGFSGWANNNGAPLPGFNDPNTTYNFQVAVAPVASWVAQTSICQMASPLSLSGGSPSGGTYSGPGVSNGQFDPSLTGVGTFTLLYVVLDATGCLSDTVFQQITVNPITQAAFAPISPLCIDSAPLVLTGGSPEGGSYAGPGVSAGIFDPAIAGVGTHSLIYSVTNAAGCMDTAMRSMTVEAVPDPPSIQQQGESLYTLSSGIHTWYLNGNPITGATDSVYLATQSGSYTVKVSNESGCTSALSDEFSLVITHLQAVQMQEINIYPNPTSNNLYLTLDQALSTELLVHLLDIQGKVVHQQVIQPGSAGTVSLSFAHLTQGMYILRLSQQDRLFQPITIYKQ